MAEATETRETSTETSRKVISDPFKEFKIVGFSGSVDEWPKWSKKFILVCLISRNVTLI